LLISVNGDTSENDSKREGSLKQNEADSQQSVPHSLASESTVNVVATLSMWSWRSVHARVPPIPVQPVSDYMTTLWWYSHASVPKQRHDTCATQCWVWLSNMYNCDR